MAQGTRSRRLAEYMTCPLAKKCWLGDVCNATSFCKEPLVDKEWNGSKTREPSKVYKELKEKQEVLE